MGHCVYLVAMVFWGQKCSFRRKRSRTLPSAVPPITLTMTVYASPSVKPIAVRSIDTDTEDSDTNTSELVKDTFTAGKGGTQGNCKFITTMDLMN